MTINEKKSAIQYNALKSWSDNGFIGCMLIATGVGKSRIGTIAAAEFIKRNNTEKTLVTVSRTNLKKDEWVNEFAKWNYTQHNVTIECHQSAYKKTGEYYDTLVVDECHNVLSEKYSNLIKNNKFKRILFLTATLNKKKIKFLEELGIPIIFTYSADQASNDGIICENQKFTIMTNFLYKESETYKEINKKITNLNGAIGSKNNAFPLVQDFLNNGFTFNNLSKDVCKGISGRYMTCVNNRKRLLYNAQRKKDITLDLIEYFGNKSIIIFSEETQFCDEINALIQEKFGDISVVYHSKVSPPKLKVANLDAFRNGHKQILISAQALNEGLNIPSVEVGIIVSGNSSQLGKIRRERRIFRYEEGKKAFIVHLCVEDTIEELWIAKSYDGRSKPIIIHDITDINL